MGRVLVLTSLLISLALLTTLLVIRQPREPRTHQLELIILVDNNPFDGLKAAWGLSLLAKINGTSILFDTGPDPEVLRSNCEALGVDLSSVDFVVLSHEHADHTGGISYVISRNPGIKIYVPEGFDEGLIRRMEELGADVVVLEGPTELDDGIMTTGPLRGPPSEQGLLVRIPEGSGWVLMTGCAHPGIEEMMRRAKNLTGNLYAVIGGFHLIGADANRLRSLVEAIKEVGVKEVYPIHCSGDEARFFIREHLPEAYRDGHVGSVIRWERG
ncbi:MAG: MBL fold metallo-hydrolase [Candidatus Korarchaeota archaeon]|nr:MBL fold metallo-hydrolase [Candidatus Korarchaeota archaeon]